MIQSFISSFKNCNLMTWSYSRGHNYNLDKFKDKLVDNDVVEVNAKRWNELLIEMETTADLDYCNFHK